MYLHLHFWRLSQHYSCLFYMSACAACLIATTQAHFVFDPFHYIRTPLQPWPTMGDATTPDRASTPEVAVTTDFSDHGTPPPQTHNDSNYHFNHPTPGNTVYYNPTTVMDQLHITERQTTTTPPLPDNTPYAQFFTALTLEEYQLLSHQQATPLAQLDYTQPIYCIPGDLRMPHYNSTLLSVSLPEAANVHYYHTTSLHTTTGDNNNYVIIQLQIQQPLLLRYLTSGQFIQTTTASGTTIFGTITCHYYYLSHSTTSTTETNSTTTNTRQSLQFSARVSSTTDLHYSP